MKRFACAEIVGVVPEVAPDAERTRELLVFGRTSLTGVAADGDVAQGPGMPGPVSAVAAAIASGQLAANAIGRELAAADDGLSLPA